MQYENAPLENLQKFSRRAAAPAANWGVQSDATFNWVKRVDIIFKTLQKQWAQKLERIIDLCSL